MKLEHQLRNFKNAFSIVRLSKVKSLTRMGYSVCALLLSGCSSTSDIGHTGITFDIHPSGNQIAFTAKGKGTRDIYLLDLKTFEVSRLTDSPAFESDPCFSHDGKWIVYSASSMPNDPKSPYHLYLLNLETKEVRQLTSETGVSDSSPMFVMNGSQILFSRSHRLRPYSMGGYVWDNSSLYVINRDGAGETALPLSRYYSVSPGGHHLITISYDRNNHPFVRIAVDKLLKEDSKIKRDDLLKNGAEKNAEWRKFMTEAYRTIPRETIEELPSALNNEFIAISELVEVPNSKYFGLISDKHRIYDYQVWIYDSFKNQARQLTPQDDKPSGHECLRTMPDGKSFLFLRREEIGLTQKNGIWRVNIDGTNFHQVADYTLFDDPLNWKPKERR